MWRALEYANLKLFAQSLPNKLDNIVEDNSEFFSVGQKQLLSLARALLKQSKILILDEASSNLDIQSDIFLQQVIREKFPNSTVLTIAHRLNTVADYDRIIVLEKG